MFSLVFEKENSTQIVPTASRYTSHAKNSLSKMLRLNFVYNVDVLMRSATEQYQT